jgi:hypothetical protein
MKPVLLWPKPVADIAKYLERKPDDFTVVDTNSYYDFRKLSALRSDTPIFDPYPKYGRHYRDFLNHVNASHCRHHVVGLAACQDVLRTLNDPSLSNATIEEIILAVGDTGQGRAKQLAFVPPLTRFLSRLLGLFLALVSLVALANRQTMLEAVDALLHNRPLSVIVGTITVLAGLAMVLAHNVWSSGVLPVVVTIIGWIVLAAGLSLLALPDSATSGLWQMLHVEDFFYAYLTATLALGLYLSYAGFSALPSPPRQKR